MGRKSPHVTPSPPNGSLLPVPVVGIGTSAGGLEALELFLRHVPQQCGLAFVIIQHLSPDHVGSLPDLLQRCTSMKVLQVNGDTPVKPDHVYVIPPNREMVIRNRELHIQESVTSHGLRLPIDRFFCSLAEEYAERSIGVILSGMGSDGTKGLRAIKEQAGLTLAQEPATARFDSMPRSVVEAGLVDIVAPAEELPPRIIDYLRCPVFRGAEEVPADDQNSFARITAILKVRTKHDFSMYKTSSVFRRIERRMGIHKIDSLAGYATYLQKNSQEVDLLFKELLIGVTSFFRDPAMWDELKNIVLPKILAGYPEGGTLRAWSCGCSTGEEAFSLAMVFLELLDTIEHPERYSLQIFATDLDPDAISHARRGVFAAAAVDSEVSRERLMRFFIKEESQYRVRKDVREMVTLAQQNVIMDPPFTRLDILVCRNLLIYLTTDLQKKLLPLFHYSLKPGGLLFLGSAETAGAHGSLFRQDHSRSKFYWRSDVRLPQEPISFPTAFISKNLALAPQEFPMLKTADNLQLLADRLILQNFSAPAVMANEQGDIVYISGRTGKYLEPAAGKANLNVFAMAREGLRYELGSAFGKALQQREPVTVRAGHFESNDGVVAVDLTVMKIEGPDALRGMVLIAFRDVVLPRRSRKSRSRSMAGDSRVEELEQELMTAREELRTTREEMQTAHEELKSMNEELQSTNEELQSTNEELTTSKEEMQSMNEELQSVNSEQAARLDEFMRINNDMENLLNSTEIVTVFLDNQLKVRRFTSGANRLFKLISSDVGRPLTDIVSDLNYPHLNDHVQDVLRKLVSLESQVSTLEGSWYLVRIMPYRTMDKMIDGVVITCSDITLAKTAEDALRQEIAQLKAQLEG